MVSRGNRSPHLGTHILAKGDEGNIEQKHGPVADLLLDNGPTIILRADVVATLAPVIECQPRTPHRAEHAHIVQSLRRQPIGMRPGREMRNVNGREDTPEAVDLRVVPIHFGGDEDNDGQGKGEGEGGDERVRVEIQQRQLLHFILALEDGDEFLREFQQLWDVGSHREVEVGALRHRAQRR